MNNVEAAELHTRVDTLEIAVCAIQKTLGLEAAEEAAHTPVAAEQEQRSTIISRPFTPQDVYRIEAGSAKADHRTVEIQAVQANQTGSDEETTLISPAPISAPGATDNREGLGNREGNIPVGLSHPRRYKGVERPATTAPGPHRPGGQLNFNIEAITENWLNKIGIMLFLLGVVFLFKYAVDNNWLSEQTRIAAGLLLGTILLVAGLGLRRGPSQLPQVLLGGAIATYYITAYASYLLFPDLHIPYEQIFAFTAAVTFLAYTLAAKRGELALALIGLTGGLLTPFALGISQVQLPALTGYTCLIMLGTAGVYMLRGWRSLLWSAAGVVLATLLYSYSQAIFFRGNAAPADRWSLQVGAIVALLTFWAVPVVREILSSAYPDRWARPPFRVPDGQEYLAKWFDPPAYALTEVAPLATLLFSTLIWSGVLFQHDWGWIELAGALVLELIAWGMRRMNRGLAYTHAIIGVALLTISLLSILSGNVLLLALAAEAGALHLLAYRYSDKGATIAGYILFSGIGIMLLERLTQVGDMSQPILNARALTDLALIAAAMSVSFTIRSKEVALTYRSMVHLTVMAWLWRELHGMTPYGDGYVMVLWAAYGLALHLVARRISGRLNSLGTTIAAHFAFEAAFGLLAWRLTAGLDGGVPLFNQNAGLDIVVIGLALASSFLVRSRRIATTYRLVVHIAVLGWLLHESTYADLVQGYVMLRWAGYLAMVAFVSRRMLDKVTLRFTNIAFGAVGGLLAWHLSTSREGALALLNAGTLVDLLAIGAIFAASFLTAPPEARQILRIGAHIAVLALLWREMYGLPQGYSYIILAWATYATLLQAVVWRIKDEYTGLYAHGIFAGAGLWLLGNIAHGLIFVNKDALAVLNHKGLTNLGVIALAAAVYFIIRRDHVGIAYAIGMHVALLGWLWQELGLIPPSTSGNGYATIAWGVYALVLLLAGFRMAHNKPLIYAGISTLMLIAAKLLLIDLRYLEAVWRILLFLGFGGLFLLLSYYFQRVARYQGEML
ncbi:MAG: DUF2339 domain-containing protein [Chloroflexota bacterium]|nr:DUF2339 domain-containing protein [Chloroflexota bacterium]